MLEARQLLTAAPIISEFMASNRDTLNDAYGESSDWIELFNAGDMTADLTDWYLTDDAEDLTKWRFPATTLDAGAYLVVFASDKNRTTGQELHTNFKLAGNGEFLALVEADGATLASSFAPAYPPQRADYSYGLAAAAPLAPHGSRSSSSAVRSSPPSSRAR